MRRLFAIAALAACHGGAAGTVGTTASAPASTTEQDALWAFAPPGTELGVVASGRGVSEVEHGGVAVLAAINAAPDLAPYRKYVASPILGTTFGNMGADFGLAPGKGGAVFRAGSGELLVLPVIDRDKFLRAVGGKRGSADDTFGKDTCRTIGAEYVCARPASLLDQVGKGSSRELAELAGARGDLEVLVSVPDGAHPVKVGAVAQLAAGEVVLRGSATGVPAEVLSQFGRPRAPRTDATTAGFATVDLTKALAKLPSSSFIPGLTLADLGRSIGEPITVTMPAGPGIAFDARVPLTDAAPLTKLLGMCALAPIPGVKYEGGVCHVPVGALGQTIAVRIAHNTLQLSFDGQPTGGVAAPMTAVGRELAAGEWSLAMYGRGTILGAAAVGPLVRKQHPDEGDLILRAAELLDEVGFGIRADGDRVWFLASVRTLWSNPADVVAKVLAIAPSQFGTADTTKAFAAIADAAPDSPFAHDLRAGTSGLILPVLSVGALTAVAVPAFLDYMKKSKKPEAVLELDKIAKNAKVYYITNAAYPKGEAPLTPAKSCCAMGTDNRCHSTTADWQQAAWQQVDFEIDEPSLYQYSYKSDGKTFTAEAVGDLDCDGTFITYKMTGTINDGNPQTTLTEPPADSD